MALLHAGPPRADVCGTALGRKAGAGKELRLMLRSRAVLPAGMRPASLPASCPASRPTRASSQALPWAALLPKRLLCSPGTSSAREGEPASISPSSPQPCKWPQLRFEWLLPPSQGACPASPGPPCLYWCCHRASSETRGCSFALESGQGGGGQSLLSSCVSR